MANNINELEKKLCCGCASCSQICPKKAVELSENAEGFLYPKIDIEKCTNCGLCKKACPILNCDIEEKEDYPKAYAAKNKNKEEIMKSSSGGIFVVLANYIIEKNGIIYGAAYTDNNSVEHIRVDNEEDLKRLQGSKYVQSTIGNIYKKVKEDLENKKQVLFSGTPCQVHGLKKFLLKEYDNLITIDLVCHGVPSQKLFKKYLSYLEKKYNKKIKSYNFRSKDKKGWGLTAKVTFEDECIKFINSDFDPYYNNFLNCNSYRESCYNCKFANKNRVSDITLADYWGILSIHNEFYDENGVSLLLINSNKGENILNKLESKIDFIKTNLDYASSRNKNIICASTKGEIRNKIYNNIDSLDSYQYIKNNLKYKVTIKKVLKILVPNKLKKIIMKLKGVKK